MLENLLLFHNARARRANISILLLKTKKKINLVKRTIHRNGDKYYFSNVSIDMNYGFKIIYPRYSQPRC